MIVYVISYTTLMTKKVFSLYIAISAVLTVFAHYQQEVHAAPADLSITTTINPQEIKQGESFTFNITVINNTYKETYDPGDFKMTNPSVEIKFDKGNFLTPQQTSWVLPLGSMEHKQAESFQKTFYTKNNIPVGSFGMTIVSYTDKSDSGTMDHETMGHQPLSILASSQNGVPIEAPASQEAESEETERDCETPIKMDEKFFGEGSSTTKLDQLCVDELKTIENPIFEIVNRNKVMFPGTFDFSSEIVISRLNEMNDPKYFDLSQIGMVFIDTEYYPFFQIPAHIEMYSVPFKDTPYILQDYVRVTQEQVSDVIYIYSETEKGTMTFEASNFSRFSLEQKEMEPIPPLNDRSLYKLLLLIGIITLQGIVVAVIVKKILIKRNQERKAK
jgi:hypothetical protein